MVKALLTKYLNQYYSAFSDDYASIVDFNDRRI